MAVIDNIINFIGKEVETVVKFITTPMGVYEFRDEIIKNLRSFMIETAKTIGVPSLSELGFRKAKVLRG